MLNRPAVTNSELTIWRLAAAYIILNASHPRKTRQPNISLDEEGTGGRFELLKLKVNRPSYIKTAFGSSQETPDAAIAYNYALVQFQTDCSQRTVRRENKISHHKIYSPQKFRKIKSRRS